MYSPLRMISPPDACAAQHRLRLDIRRAFLQTAHLLHKCVTQQQNYLVRNFRVAVRRPEPKHGSRLRIHSKRVTMLLNYQITQFRELPEMHKLLKIQSNFP